MVEQARRTFEALGEMIIETPERQKKRVRRQEEARLQAECYAWAWNERPITRRVLFHVENERTDGNKVDGARRRAMGLVAGVSDLLLLLPRGRYHGLCIEMKTPDGYQREEQKTWQALVEANGYRYEVIRTKEDFQELIDNYLAGK